MGSRGIAPRFLTSALYIWRLVVSFTPWPLYPQGKSSRYSLNRTLGGPQSQSGCCGEEKNVLPLSGTEPWASSSQSVVIATELSRFLATLLEPLKRGRHGYCRKQPQLSEGDTVHIRMRVRNCQATKHACANCALRLLVSWLSRSAFPPQEARCKMISVTRWSGHLG
jgi:hypothetical protein